MATEIQLMAQAVFKIVFSTVVCKPLHKGGLGQCLANVVSLGKAAAEVAETIEYLLIFNAFGNSQQVKAPPPFNDQLHNLHINWAVEHV